MKAEDNVAENIEQMKAVTEQAGQSRRGQNSRAEARGCDSVEHLRHATGRKGSLQAQPRTEVFGALARVLEVR